MDSIRLLLAGLTVLAALFGSSAFWSNVLPKNTPPFLLALALALSIIPIVLGVLVLFNLGRRRPPAGPTFEELRAEGLIESIELRATRAFEVEEFEDEGMHYFIELADGSVLYLTGQYLYYLADERSVGADGVARPVFPNTEFTVLKHRTEHYSADILCRGTAMKPEFVAPEFPKWWWDDPPQDRHIFRDRSYDQLKAEFAGLRKAWSAEL